MKLKPTCLLKLDAEKKATTDISLNALINDRVWFGAAYRSGDATSVFAGLQISNQLRLAYAYDYTISELKKFTSGSHEISLGYDFSFNKKNIVTPRFF